MFSSYKWVSLPIALWWMNADYKLFWSQLHFFLQLMKYKSLLSVHYHISLLTILVYIIDNSSPLQSFTCYYLINLTIILQGRYYPHRKWGTEMLLTSLPKATQLVAKQGLVPWTSDISTQAIYPLPYCLTKFLGVSCSTQGTVSLLIFWLHLFSLEYTTNAQYIFITWKKYIRLNSLFSMLPHFF